MQANPPMYWRILEKAIPPSLDEGNKIVGVTMLVSAAFSRIADLHGRAVFHD